MRLVGSRVLALATLLATPLALLTLDACGSDETEVPDPTPEAGTAQDGSTGTGQDSSTPPPTDGSTGGDSGGDGGNLDGGADSGAKVPPSTPGKITCGDAGDCNTPTQACCQSGQGLSTYACIAANAQCGNGVAPPQEIRRECEEAADCNAGERCCLTLIGQTRANCQAACQGAQYCRTDSECADAGVADASTCVPQNCADSGVPSYFCGLRNNCVPL